VRQLSQQPLKQFKIDTTSVVEESVPVENNTADTLTTDNTEVSANYSENTDG
jgi:clumping factor B